MTRELLGGLTRFKQEYFPPLEEHYRMLVAQGQSPHTLFIGCADSRVIPSRLTDSGPGDLFVVRNVGNIVPPHDAGPGYHGVAAGIEYAVDILEVQDIVVCGHSHCGAVMALYDPPAEAGPNTVQWLQLARDAVVDEDVSNEVLRRTEQRNIVLQLDRLMDFPTVRSRVEAGDLALHGWHYIIEDGQVLVLDLESGEFMAHGG